MNTSTFLSPRTAASLFLAVLCLCALPQRSNAADFPSTRTVADVELQLIGTGTFRYMFFKLYDGALYMPEGVDPSDPLADVAKRLELVYARTITAAQFIESGDTILQRNVDPATFERIQPMLRQINAAYEDAQEGDVYALTYIPGRGTSLERNGTEVVLIEGAEFAAAYFSIWLGERSAKRSFRDDLLDR
jgi:hypothetical protein